MGLVYIYYDPFMLVRHYDYSKPLPSTFTNNKDYLATELFVVNYSKKHYNSYIFGNSRSRVYYINEWQKYIGDQSCFHYFAFNESLYGLERKIAFIDEHPASIKNALVIIDARLLAVDSNSAGAVFRKHPAITGEYRLKFQLCAFRDFMDIHVLKAFAKYLVQPNNKKFNRTTQPYNAMTNEISYRNYEQMIKGNPDSFYANKGKTFYKRNTELLYAKPVIKEGQLALLNNIKAIFSKQNTSYRIVISPMYNQMQLNSTDLGKLRAIFGKDKVFDFSGINRITGDVHNYYESSHYRVNVANEIMAEIYKKQ